MAIKKTCYKIVIASPSDVNEERKIVEETIDKVNEYFKDSSVYLESRQWETDAYPSFHPEGPQGIIDETLDIKNSDIFVGIFFLRFGKPVKNSDSGTLHEIKQAIKSYKEDSRPEIKLFFKKPVKVDLEKLDKQDFEQFEKIKDFKKEMSSKGIIGTFETIQEFRYILEKELTRYLLRKTGVIVIKSMKLIQTTIEVNNEIEFVKAIDSNRKIVLNLEKYNLSDLEDLRTESIYHEKVFDGGQIIIKGVKNLTIVSKGNKSELAITPLYANVLTFRECEDITISNIIACHSPNKGFCTGAVFDFENCSNVNINESVLYGSGADGLILTNVNTFIFESSVIEDCTQGIMTISNSKNILFRRGTFKHNQIYFSGIAVSDFSLVEFNECQFVDNFSVSEIKRLDQLFATTINSDILLKNSIIKCNNIANLSMNKRYIKMENVTTMNNKFDESN